MNKIYIPLCFLLRQTFSPVMRARGARGEISQEGPSVSLQAEHRHMISFLTSANSILENLLAC